MSLTESLKSLRKKSAPSYMNFHGFKVFRDADRGYSPYFQSMLAYRIKRKLATNIVVTGEAGIGKSYLATDIARIIEGLDENGNDRFSLDQVVFTYAEFMDLVLELEHGRPIVFDEPSYAMGKREWYRDLNRVLVQTIESFRFKVHPLIIPIINKSLLDKTLREHLIQYQVVVYDRGKATVYRVKPSQFIDRVYYAYFCKLEYSLLDMHLCNRESCLDCSQLATCNIFRARYERKKASIQDTRYEQARDQAAQVETRKLTVSQLENLALSIKDKFIENGKLSVQKLRVAMMDTYGISLSNPKAYQLKASLEIHYGNKLYES
ncbi:MAG: hypothetical protein QXV01_02475 [Candidatus Bathyarchaeia archaeon]